MRPEEKVYQAFFEFKESKLYYNQIKEYTKLSHSSLQNVLIKLTKENIFKEEKSKSNVYYIIKNKKIIALKYSEISVKKLNSLNSGIKIPLKNFLKDIPQDVFTIILFGSTSRKEQTKESDIDILVVSNEINNLESNKKEAELTSNYPLSLFQCSIKQFIENQDDIIIQARKTGFPIFKEQNFYEMILNEY